MESSEVFATLNVEGKQYEVTRENATLYRHLGSAALDHLFVSIGENAGIYVWENNPNYEAISTAAVENECMLVLNIKEPADMDIKAYVKHNKKDLEDTVTVPEEWL